MGGNNRHCHTSCYCRRGLAQQRNEDISNYRRHDRRHGNSRIQWWKEAENQKSISSWGNGRHTYLVRQGAGRIRCSNTTFINNIKFYINKDAVLQLVRVSILGQHIKLDRRNRHALINQRTGAAAFDCQKNKELKPGNLSQRCFTDSKIILMVPYHLRD